MKKFMGIFSILTNKKFLLSVFGLISVLVPAFAPFFELKGVAIITSVAGISAGIALLAAYLEESPKSKTERLKGGEK